MSSKPWYASKTYWAAIITILSSACGLLGVTIGPDDAAAIATGASSLGAAVGGFLAMYGRKKANTIIGPRND